MKRVLVTGATGFVGSEIVRHLLQMPDVNEIFLPMRISGDDCPATRWLKLTDRWRKFSMLPSVESKRIVPISCDLAHMVSADLAEQCAGVDTIIHCAAATAFDLPLATARNQNLSATLKLLGAARGMPELRRFVHLSTAFVAGNRTGLITESDGPAYFNNTYEQTKFEAELAIARSNIPYTILRPSIIVGDSQTGYVVGIKVLYSVLRLWLSGILPKAPLDPHARVDIVPIDYVALATLAAAQSDDGVNETFHLTAGLQAVEIRQIIEVAMKTFGIAEPSYVPVWFARLFCKWPFKHLVDHHVSHALELMRWHIPYLGMYGRSFVDDKVQSILRSSQIAPPDFDSYGGNLFSFVNETSWGRRSRPLTRTDNQLSA